MNSNSETLIETTGLNKIKSKIILSSLLKLIQLDKVDHVYQSSSQKSGIEFIDDILLKLKIEYDFNSEDLKNIPQNAPFILVSNHPYGGIDGLILMSIILKKRPDFKVMANYMLQQIPQFKEHLVAIDPFEKGSNSTMNISGIKRSLNLLANGIPIGIFPAGEVSSFQLNKMKVSDKMWHPVVGKLIIKSDVKVIPVYFSGQNSLLFNLLGIINPGLRTAKLPSELFNKHEKIKVRIGKPVSTQTIKEFSDQDQLLRFLRAKTYSLGSSIDVKHHFLFSKNQNDQAVAVIEQTESFLIEEEINWLNENNGLLFSAQQFDIFISGANAIPNILREISRLREITFRDAGEGTNLSCDTDEFDLYYKHLFLWDKNENKIVGAYRIGEGDKLFSRFKKKGFYLNELFKFSKEFNPVFKSSLELGRSFIVKEYQKNTFALILLWKGINEFIKRGNGKYQYLIGPVSISNKFSKLSKDILVDYISKNHYDKILADFVRPRKRYKYQHHGEEKQLRENNLKDIKLLDQIISDIEPDQSKIPVLLKKYLMQNAKIISFSVDPKFNHSLDGLLVMKLDEIPTETFDMVKLNSIN